MFNRASSIGSEHKTGQFGNLANGTGVHINETHFGFLGELAAFPHAIPAVDKLVLQTLKSTEGSSAFKIAHNRWFLAGTKALQDVLNAEIKSHDASLIDLTHGRTSLLVSGPKAQWVLSKLYPIDFSSAAFQVGTGISTTHHNVFTQIHRPYEQTFDLFVFRSFARSFWHTLTRAAEDVGYEVE